MGWECGSPLERAVQGKCPACTTTTALELRSLETTVQCEHDTVKDRDLDLLLRRRICDLGQ